MSQQVTQAKPGMTRATYNAIGNRIWMEHVCLKEVLKECKDEAVSSLLRTALEKLAEAGRLADRKSAVK